MARAWTGPPTELAAIAALGALLRNAGVLQRSDADVTVRVAQLVALPALAFETVVRAGLPRPLLAALPLSGMVVAAAPVGVALALSTKAARRDRAAALGSATGASVLVAAAAAHTCLGPAGAAAVLLAGAPVALAATAGAYTAMSTAGAAFPASYEHADGGVYAGEWRGVDKAGRGVYRYKSGARYEGEWRDNLKNGRGVYYYPKGGAYEGEWVAGRPHGLGVRTFSDGRVKAGRWSNGQLDEPLELWQCAQAAQGASEAAAAARAVRGGGFRAQEAAAASLSAPAAWAALAAAALCATGVSASVPAPVLDLASWLGRSAAPMAFLSLGVAWRPQWNPRLAAQAAAPLAARFACGGFVASAAVVAVARGVAGDAWAALAAVAVGALALAPAEFGGERYAERFRLNVGVVDCATTLSQAVGGVATVLFCALSQKVLALRFRPGTGGADAAAALVFSWSAAGVALAAAAVCVVGAVWLQGQWGTESRMRMVYQAGGREGRRDDPGAGSGPSRGASARLQSLPTKPAGGLAGQKTLVIDRHRRVPATRMPKLLCRPLVRLTALI